MNTSISPAFLAEGALLASKYRIMGELGRGAGSRVYLAIQENIGIQRAIKCIPKNRLQSGYGELMALRDLDHPCLPHLVDLLEGADTVCLVMELVDGQSLRSYMDQIQPGELSADQLLDWGIELTRILIYLHGRQPPLIYRDLKPANVMICPNGRLKLIDFGTLTSLSDLPDQESSLGSPAYAAPEQFEGSFDERSDLYALGVCLKEMFDYLPDDKGSRRDGLRQVIEGCCKKRPEDRFQTAGELEAALTKLSATGNLPSGQGRVKRRTFLLPAGILLLTVLCFCTVLSALWRGDKTSQNQTKSMGARLETMLRRDKEDLVFSQEEEKDLLELLASEPSKRLAREEPLTYAAICLQLGKLYWYYYGIDASGDQIGQEARMQAAGEWLERGEEALRRSGDQHVQGEEALRESRDQPAQGEGTHENRAERQDVSSPDLRESRGEVKKELEEHLALIHFHREIAKWTREGREKGLYRAHFLRLKEYENSLDKAENDLIRARGRQEVLESLYRQRGHFLEDGVSKEEYEQVLGRLAENIRAMRSGNPFVTKVLEDSRQLLDLLERERGGKI